MAAAFVMAAVSCKDDDETVSLPSLDGLIYSCPSFVEPGAQVKFVPRGVVHPEGEGIGYYWKVSPVMTKYDTTRLENGLDKYGNMSDGSFSFEFPDSLGAYTVSASAFASGYASDVYQKEVMVAEGGIDRSITNSGINADDPKITVDGIDYYYVEVEGLDWFRRNLASDASGVSYGRYDVTSDVFGRYYSHEEAMTACPDGWRLPTDEEWLSLCSTLGAAGSGKYSVVEDVAAGLFAMADFNGSPMLEYWPEVGDVTNASGMSVLPVGYANLGERSSDGKYPYAAFEGIYEYAAFWTADKVEGEDGMAYYRYLIADQPDFFVEKGDVKSFGASVRCVRDAE